MPSYCIDYEQGYLSVQRQCPLLVHIEYQR